MLTLVLIICALAVIFVACERWLGSSSSTYAEGSMDAEFSASRLSFWEASTRALPLLLAGIGLPLALAWTLPGIFCLVTACSLFLIGRMKG